MRYDLIRLAQLFFALTLMFGAFLGGLFIGWLRWGRGHQETVPARVAVPPPAHSVKHDLFSPDSDSAQNGQVVFDGVVVDGDVPSPPFLAIAEPVQLAPIRTDVTYQGER